MPSLKPNPVLRRARKPIVVPVRVAIREDYVPAWEGEVEGWVANHLKENFWRVRCTNERDDVLQEARIVFLRVAGKYPGVEARHFMALFKTAWTRRFTDLSNEDTQHRDLHPPMRQDAGEDYHYTDGISLDPIGETDNSGYLRLMVQQAPREVKMVLSLFLNAPAELLELALKTWREDRRCRTNGSARICAMLGLPADLDVMQMTADYFGHSR